MRLVHLSDSHGRFYTVPRRGIDATIHSGDFLPNKTRGNLDIEPVYQEEWLLRHKPIFLEWMPLPMPFLFCRGNHDFMNPVPILQEMGINAIDISGQIAVVGDLKFFGFPFTPWFTGEWWGELTTREMTMAMEGLLLVLERDKPDVLVSHGPMYGILDEAYGENCGSKDLFHLLTHVTKHLPKLFLCGHIHESHGEFPRPIHSVGGQQMRVFNSATTFHVIEV